MFATVDCLAGNPCCFALATKTNGMPPAGDGFGLRGPGGAYAVEQPGMAPPAEQSRHYQRMQSEKRVQVEL